MSAAPETFSQRSGYRALILRSDNTVAKVQRLLAVDDDEALALAQSMVDGHAVELWDGLRFIEHYASVDEHHGESN